MSADVIAFPSKFTKKTIDTEEEMVQWSVYQHVVETKRYSRSEAEEFGRSLWREFQNRSKRKQLEDDIYAVSNGWVLSGSARDQIYNQLRVRFCVNSINDIPGDQLDEAIAVVAEMKNSVSEFLRAMCQVRDSFQRKVLGGGEPWTPWVKRTLKRNVGERPNWRELAAEIERRNV